MGTELSTILIVEDEAPHAELTRRAIRKAGHAGRIDIVTDGAEALDYLFRTGNYANAVDPMPSLIVLDLKLPCVNGLEVLKKIKTNPQLCKIPVIMLTTSGRDEDIAASYEMHANSYLTKPVGFKEFEEKVMQLDFYWMKLNEQPPAQD